jgi:C-terminal processing protease CtpA/Prc
MKKSFATLLAAACFAAGGTGELGAQEVIYYRAQQLAECGRLGLAFLPADEGIVVADLLPGAPGERAGLRTGDQVVLINGAPANMVVLEGVSRALKPGETVRFQLRRGGRLHDVNVVAARGTCTRQVIAAEEFAALQEALTMIQGGTVRLDTLRINLVEATRARESAVITLRSPLEQRQAVALRERAEVLRQPAIVHMRDAAQGRLDALGFGRSEAIMAALDSLLKQFESDARGAHPLPVRLHDGAMTGVIVSDGVPVRLLPTDALEVGARTVAGAEFSELNAELAQYFRGTGEGLLVLRVAPETPGARAGLRPGDVVVRASGRAIRTIRDLRLSIASAGRQPVTIDVVRQGQRHELRLPLER